MNYFYARIVWKQNIILTLLLSIELLLCGVPIICDDVVWTFGVTENQSRKPSDDVDGVNITVV